MVQYEKSELNQMGESTAPEVAAARLGASHVCVPCVPRPRRRLCGAALAKNAELPTLVGSTYFLFSHIS